MKKSIQSGICAVVLLFVFQAVNASKIKPNQSQKQIQSKVYNFDPTAAEEFRMRDGLPNFFAKLAAGDTVRVAYLGGSITVHNGWRPKSLAWFRSHYPKATIIEINAAISGTGSDFGACRIATDVLSKKPDLVFMEHRVNGGSGFEANSTEGSVRQILKNNPFTDICFIYTISIGMLPEIQAGKTPSFGAIMEKIANKYGIPTIDFGVEVAKREKEGTLIFKGKDEIEGKLLFSNDGTHPKDAGHEIYKEVLIRSFLKMEALANKSKHVMPLALSPNCWETATIVPINKVKVSQGWTNINTKTDTTYTQNQLRTSGMLRDAMMTNKVGETVTVKWNGTTIAFSDIPVGDDTEVEITVDKLLTPIVYKRIQTEKQNKYSRFMYLPELIPGEHTAVLKVKRIQAGENFYLGQILVVGKFIE